VESYGVAFGNTEYVGEADTLTFNFQLSAFNSKQEIGGYFQ